MGDDNGGFGYFDNLWNWLSGIVDWLKSIAEGVVQIPLNLWNYIKDIPGQVWEFVKQIPGQVWGFFESAFSSLGDVVSNIWNAVKGIPDAILDCLKWLFVPREDKINGSIQSLSNTFKSTFGIDSYDISNVLGTEAEISNQTATINIAGFEFTCVFLDVRYLVNAIGTFRPVIRGFVVFMLVLYNLNQFFALIRMAPMGFGQHLQNQPMNCNVDYQPMLNPPGFPRLKG